MCVCTSIFEQIWQAVKRKIESQWTNKTLFYTIINITFNAFSFQSLWKSSLSPKHATHYPLLIAKWINLHTEKQVRIVHRSGLNNEKNNKKNSLKSKMKEFISDSTMVNKVIHRGAPLLKTIIWNPGHQYILFLHCTS